MKLAITHHQLTIILAAVAATLCMLAAAPLHGTTHGTAPAFSQDAAGR